MKKIIYIISICGVLFASCTKDFKEINTDPNSTINALPQQLLAPALVNAMSVNMIRGNRNYNNELMQVTVNMTDGDGAVFRYDIRAAMSDYLYNGLYSELTNFKDIYKIASQEQNYSSAYMGISLICQSWIYSLLTDTYGDVPYFHSNMAKDSVGFFEPPFDRQKDIYLDIFKKLEAANDLLRKDTTVGGDPIYGGSAAKWRKFGNSLYLRLLLRVSGKAEVASDCIAKIREIVDDNPANYPIMSSNSESAILKWTGVSPYVSPYYISVRDQDFRAPAIASFFIDHLSVWSDPRIDIPTYGSGSPTRINRWAIAPYSGRYVGVPSGYSPGQGLIKLSYFYSYSTNSNAGPSLQTEALTGMIMNYAELQFILAEAAAKGWIKGSAETYYNTGAQSSITLWLPQWTVPIKDYLTAADIEWDESLTLDQKMERIHLQKYYALFLTDLQQWIEYRRTGHPVLPKGPGLMNNGIMPARMVYPVYVQSANPTNYKLAVAAQGPDEINTQVWWQKP